MCPIEAIRNMLTLQRLTSKARLGCLKGGFAFTEVAFRLGSHFHDSTYPAYLYDLEFFIGEPASNVRTAMYYDYIDLRRLLRLVNECPSEGRCISVQLLFGNSATEALDELVRLRPAKAATRYCAATKKDEEKEVRYRSDSRHVNAPNVPVGIASLGASRAKVYSSRAFDRQIRQFPVGSSRTSRLNDVRKCCYLSQGKNISPD